MNDKHLSPWKDWIIPTAIVLPALYWVSVIGKRLIGFNLLYWSASLLNKEGGAGSFEGLGRTAIDDPVVLGIGAACTACFGAEAFFRNRDRRLVRELGNTVDAEVNGVKRLGYQTNVSGRIEQHVNREYLTGETIPAETLRAAQRSRRDRLPNNSKTPQRSEVQQTGRRAQEGYGKAGPRTALPTSDAPGVARPAKSNAKLLMLLENAAVIVSGYSSMNLFCGHSTGAEFAAEIRSLAARVARRDFSAVLPLTGIFAPSGRWDDGVGSEDEIGLADDIMALLVAIEW